MLAGRLRIVVLATAALSITVAACARAEAPSVTRPSPLTTGGEGKAGDFELAAYQGEEVLGGSRVMLSSVLARGEPVVLNFWAGLCPPCRAEMPDFEQVHQQYKGRVLMLGLDVGPFVRLGSREDGKRLLQELKVTYPAGTTFDTGVIDSYEILGMPTTVFITPEGRVLRKWTSVLSKAKLVEFVEELLTASTAERTGQ